MEASGSGCELDPTKSTKRILYLDLVIFSSFQNLLPHPSGWSLGYQTWVLHVCALSSPWDLALVLGPVDEEWKAVSGN